MWEGSIPFFDTDDEIGQIATKYKLFVTERTFPYKTEKWFALSPSSVQVLWEIASEKLDLANATYFGDTTDAKPIRNGG